VRVAEAYEARAMVVALVAVAMVVARQAMATLAVRMALEIWAKAEEVVMARVPREMVGGEAMVWD